MNKRNNDPENQKNTDEKSSTDSFKTYSYRYSRNRNNASGLKKDLQDDVTVQNKSTKQCYNCKINRTTIWRWNKTKEHVLCNACGLYEKTHNKSRPIKFSNYSSPRLLKKTEIYNNCVLCDAVITDILPEYKALCYKCVLISDTIDVNSFNVFNIEIKDKKNFGSGGRFFKFRVYR